jgi:hypothetical protein
MDSRTMRWRRANPGAGSEGSISRCEHVVQDIGVVEFDYVQGVG